LILSIIKQFTKIFLDFCTSWPFYFLWVQRKTKRKR